MNGEWDAEGELISNGDPYYTLFLPERTFVSRFRDFRCVRVHWDGGKGTLEFLNGSHHYARLYINFLSSRDKHRGFYRWLIIGLIGVCKNAPGEARVQRDGRRPVRLNRIDGENETEIKY